MLGQGHVTHRGDLMAELLILEFAGLSDADYAAVNGNLGIDTRPARGTGLRACSRTRAAIATRAPSW